MNSDKYYELLGIPRERLDKIFKEADNLFNIKIELETTCKIIEVKKDDSIEQGLHKRLKA